MKCSSNLFNNDLMMSTHKNTAEESESSSAESEDNLSFGDKYDYQLARLDMFNTFPEAAHAIKTFCAKNFHPIVTVPSYINDPNSNDFYYKAMFFTCVHYGTYKPERNRICKKENIYRSGCPFIIKLTLSQKNYVHYRITYLNLSHNHDIGPSIYNQYLQEQVLNEEEKYFVIEMMIQSNAQNDEIVLFIREFMNKSVSNADIYNLRIVVKKTSSEIYKQSERKYIKEIFAKKWKEIQAKKKILPSTCQGNVHSSDSFFNLSHVGTDVLGDRYDSQHIEISDNNQEKINNQHLTFSSHSYPSVSDVSCNDTYVKRDSEQNLYMDNKQDNQIVLTSNDGNADEKLVSPMKLRKSLRLHKVTCYTDQTNVKCNSKQNINIDNKEDTQTGLTLNHGNVAKNIISMKLEKSVKVHNAKDYTDNTNARCDSKENLSIDDQQNSQTSLTSNDGDIAKDSISPQKPKKSLKFCNARRYTDKLAAVITRLSNVEYKLKIKTISLLTRAWQRHENIMHFKEENNVLTLLKENIVPKADDNIKNNLKVKLLPKTNLCGHNIDDNEGKLKTDDNIKSNRYVKLLPKTNLCGHNIDDNKGKLSYNLSQSQNLSHGKEQASFSLENVNIASEVITSSVEEKTTFNDNILYYSQSNLNSVYSSESVNNLPQYFSMPPYNSDIHSLSINNTTVPSHCTLAAKPPNATEYSMDIPHDFYNNNSGSDNNSTCNGLQITSVVSLSKNQDTLNNMSPQSLSNVQLVKGMNKTEKCTKKVVIQNMDEKEKTSVVVKPINDGKIKPTMLFKKILPKNPSANNAFLSQENLTNKPLTETETAIKSDLIEKYDKTLKTFAKKHTSVKIRKEKKITKKQTSVKKRKEKTSVKKQTSVKKRKVKASAKKHTSVKKRKVKTSATKQNFVEKRKSIRLGSKLLRNNLSVDKTALSQDNLTMKPSEGQNQTETGMDLSNEKFSDKDIFREIGNSVSSYKILPNVQNENPLVCKVENVTGSSSCQKQKYPLLPEKEVHAIPVPKASISNQMLNPSKNCTGKSKQLFTSHHLEGNLLRKGVNTLPQETVSSVQLVRPLVPVSTKTEKCGNKDMVDFCIDVTMPLENLPSIKQEDPWEAEKSSELLKINLSMNVEMNQSNYVCKDKIPEILNVAKDNKLQNLKCSLTAVDLEDIASGHMLNDKIMNAGQALIRKMFPGIFGLQDVLLGPALKFETVSTQKFVQIIHCGSFFHWITVSTFDAPAGVVFVYDSISESIPRDVVPQICSIMNAQSPFLTIISKPMQLQANSVDCGLFALASAYTVLCGKDPSQTVYDVNNMRQHLLSGFMKNSLEEFPTVNNCIVVKSIGVTESFMLHCVCRQPLLADSSFANLREFYQCSVCKKSYHKYCKAQCCTDTHFGSS